MVSDTTIFVEGKRTERNACCPVGQDPIMHRAFLLIRDVSHAVTECNLFQEVLGEKPSEH